jgi:fumarate hydratase class II
MKAPISNFRTETDSFGPIQVPADRYWGAQTQRSLQYFNIGGERLPRPLIRALGIVKRCAALANYALHDWTKRSRHCCRRAVIDGSLTILPLVIWQTGSVPNRT